MIGGLPVKDMTCDICGLRYQIVWLQDDMTILCDVCMA